MPFTPDTAKIAGQKSKRGPGRFTDLIKETNPNRVKTLWNNLLEMAENGDLEAMKLALAYLMGKPKESMDLDVTSNGFALNIIMPEGD